MSTLRLPSHWKGMPFTAKAAWLKASGQARTYEEACSILARRKRPAPKPVPNKYWWDEE